MIFMSTQLRLFTLKSRVEETVQLIPKHVRYAISSVVGGIAMFLAVAVPFQAIWISVPIILILCYGLVWFAIFENIDRVEWIMLFALPIMWTLEWYIFFYMIPVRWLTRIVFSAVFAIFLYVLISVENIYNVGVEKNIQLQKVALTVSTIFLICLVYIAFQVIASFEFNVLISSLLVALVAWLIAIKYFWTTNPKLSVSRGEMLVALLTAVICGLFNIVFALFPFFSETTRPVLLAGLFYVVTSMISDAPDEIIFAQRSREMILIASALVVVFLSSIR